MKLAAVLTAIAPFLATDKKPDDVRAAILAADKKAKDAAGSGLGARELQEKDQAKAQDEREEAEDACAEAMDSRAAAMDAEEEESDKGKGEDSAAKDRKGARDARKGARDARKGARDSRKGARDKRAKDRNDDPERTNDEDYTTGADPDPPGGHRESGKTAVDAATVDARVKAAVAAERDRNTALREVEPILGTVAYDSASDAYKAALDKLGVDTKDVHPSAFRSMLAIAKDKAKTVTGTPLSMDAATVSGLEKVIPGYGRLR